MKGAFEQIPKFAICKCACSWHVKVLCCDVLLCICCVKLSLLSPLSLPLYAFLHNALFTKLATQHTLFCASR